MSSGRDRPQGTPPVTLGPEGTPTSAQLAKTSITSSHLGEVNVALGRRLRGDHDSGLTHMEHVKEHDDLLRLDLDIGEIDTTWVVYGTKKRFVGQVIGIPSREILQKPAASM
jgi:hypothetical protein